MGNKVSMDFRKASKYAGRALGIAGLILATYNGNRAWHFYDRSDRFVKPDLVSVYHSYPELYRKDADAETLAAMAFFTVGLIILKDSWR